MLQLHTNWWQLYYSVVSVQTRKGWVAACAIRNLCCASVLSESQAVRRSESLAAARHNEERERVSEGTAVTHPIFSLNRYNRIINHQLLYVTIVLHTDLRIRLK